MNLRELLILKAAGGGGSSPVEMTATGNPAAFTTKLAKPLNSVTVPLTYTQAGSGDPSPSNVRPISGVSSLFCIHAKKNMATLRGYSTANVKYDQAGTLSNNYGTTISTTSPESSVTITQSDATTDYGKSNYRNGYFSIRTDNMVEGQRYDVSLKVTNITSNPLDASLSDWMIMPGQGSGAIPSEVKGNVIICKNILYREAVQYRQAWEVRNCGMSCTVSEFMVTPANTNDGVFEAYDGAKLDVAFPALGKNLFDKSTGIELLEKNILVARNDGYGVPIHMKAGVTYYVYVNAGTNPNEISLRVPYQATTIYVKYTSNTGYLDYTPKEDVDVAINAYWINGRPEEATDLMVETGSKTSYEPYNNSIYGGSLDLVSGVLTIDFGSVDLGSLTWEDKTNGNVKFFYSSEVSGAKRVTQTFNTANIACDRLKTASGQDVYNGAVDNAIGANSTQVPRYRAIATGYEDASEFKTAMNGVMLYYELATPITVQLTPAQASAFVGGNTVWTNTTGNLTIEYLDKA